MIDDNLKTNMAGLIYLRGLVERKALFPPISLFLKKRKFFEIVNVYKKYAQQNAQHQK